MLLRSWFAKWRLKFLRHLSDRLPGSIPQKRSGVTPPRGEILETRCLLTTSSITLATLGSAGVKLYGVDENDQSGSAVHDIGDLNGDGYDDVLIGAFHTSGAGNIKPDAGESYVIFGRPNWSSNLTLNTTTLDGTNGITLFGVDAGDLSGHSVGRAGDVNGDGFDDLVIGADNSDGFGNVKPHAGETYVVFGRSDWSNTPTVRLSSLDGTNGFTLFGVDEGDHSGLAVSGAGDVNGDGFDDILIGAPQAASIGNLKVNGGESYLVFGKSNWSVTPALTLNTTTLDGTVGVTLFGVDPGDKCGSAVAIAGDLNGDGFDDLIIGAYNGYGPSNTRAYAGETYVVFGKSDWSATSQLNLNVTTLNGIVGVTFFGVDMNDQSGRAVSGAGDVNGDGFDDIVIGAPQAGAANNIKPNAGESYVVFGKASWSATKTLTLNTSTLNGTSGFTLFGVEYLDRSGSSVSSAGDVNGDGFDDLLIAAYAGDGAGNLTSNAGETAVVFGKSSWKSTTKVDLGKLTGSNGFSVYGIDINDTSEDSGLVTGSVTSAGDVNGDGFSDFLVSARFGDGIGNALVNSGESYLIFGKNFTNSVTRQGTVDDDTLTGTSAVDKFVGGRGNDTLIGNGGADVLSGGQGDDILAVSSVTFARVDGGTGFDTLRLDGAGLNLDLTHLADSKLTSIEAIDIRGSGANSLTLNAREVLNLTSSSNPDHTANTLTVRRDNDDVITMGDGWTQGDDAVQNGITMQVFTQGAATLLLEKLSLIHPSATLNVNLGAITEAGGVCTVTATLSEISDINVVVTLGVSGTASLSADYTRSASQIVIAAGSMTGTISLTAVQDDFYEGLEAIVVEILSVSSGSESGVRQVTIQIIDDDHAPVFTSTPTPEVPENTTDVLTLTVTDDDLPAQTVTYSITGGADRALFTITSSGVLKFKFAHDFEAPTDEDGDNQYLVQVTANDGHGGVTPQDLTVIVTDSSEIGPQLLLGGPDVTWVKNNPAIKVMPDITVSGEALAGGMLVIQIDAAGSGRRAIDKFVFPAVSTIGKSLGPQFAAGILTYQVQLSQTVSARAIQSFLRGIAFSTTTAGLAKATRTLTVTLTDINQLSSSISQTIHALKSPPP